MTTRYREIIVQGSCREMGRQLGKAAREEIRGFVNAAFDCVNKTVAISRDRANRIAHDCIPFVEEYCPDLLDELRGVSETSGVSMDELMLLQVRNQFTPDADAGCTSLAMQSADRRQSVVAQNWDNDPALDPFTIVLTRRPTNAPAHITVTQAGLIGYIGMNDHGIGLCLNKLRAP